MDVGDDTVLDVNVVVLVIPDERELSILSLLLLVIALVLVLELLVVLVVLWILGKALSNKITTISLMIVY